MALFLRNLFCQGEAATLGQLPFIEVSTTMKLRLRETLFLRKCDRCLYGAILRRSGLAIAVLLSVF